MTIENSMHEVDSLDITMKRPKLTVNARSTYIQSRLQSGDRSILPSVSSTYDLSVIIPTRNEHENIWPLLAALCGALRELRVEVIFVDDSDDDTPEVIKNAAEAMNSPLLCIQLEHRALAERRAGGLSTAVVEGLRLAQAEYVAVIDADLQHPPEQLRVLYDHAVAEQVDLVVASRYIKGGNYQGLDGVGRRLISVGFKWMAKVLFPESILRISDPLGGFFLLRRSLLTDVTLRPVGYKILLEILLRCPWRSVLEVPYQFQERVHGHSKATLKQGILALQHMQRLWHEVPTAGRTWKISLLFLFNVVIALMLFVLHFSLPGLWAGLNLAVFGVVVCLDFALFLRVLFPISRYDKDTVAPETLAHAIKSERTDSFSAIRSGATVSNNLQESERAVARKEKISKRVLSIVAVVAVILAVGWVSYALSGALVVLAALFVGAAIVSIKQVKFDHTVRMLLAIGVIIASIDYLSWRLVVTNWPGWWIAVPLLFAEVLGAIHTIGFQLTIWPWSPPVVERSEDPTWHPIFIFIPTVNEGVEVLRPTLEGIIAARDAYLKRYPHGKVNIVICNDGLVAKAAQWKDMETLAEELGVCCVTRTVGGGAKAGNIEHARQKLQATGDALLVIFDADQVAKPNFLLKTIPYFRDPKIGWVQTGQYYANLDNPTSRWSDDQQSMFYNLLCPGKASLNAAFICGTNVVLRAAPLDAIGGLPQDSVTEDFAASIALHPSWRSIYVTDVLATGLGPLDVPSYLKQQRRWAIGTLGVLRTHWREIFLPRKAGLSIGQRVQYFLACTHYLCGLRDLIYLVTPILFIFSGVPAVRGSTLEAFFWHFVPYCLLSFTALWYSSRGITGLRGIIIGFGTFPVLIESLLAVLFQRKVGFSITAKKREGKLSLSHIRVYVFFFFACLVSLLWASLRFKGLQEPSLFISMMWIVYSMLILGGFICLSIKDARFQVAQQRSGITSETVAARPYPTKLLAKRPGLRPVWSLVLAVLLATPILASAPLTDLIKSSSKPFVIQQEKIAAPYFGVSLPIQLLTSDPPVLERSLGTPFSIEGRTQDVIHDRFDRSWADSLAAQHIRPWITLQFGVFGPHNKPPLDANLPAVINGLHDAELTQWAQDIRDYNQPVYLTVFQHADRNWSLSSGVTNGGIPQDVPKAWLHVQSVFLAAGANNVAWVWAPADPLHDQLYAPPASTIDAVLQSFIDYPGTTWGDPQTVLSSLQQRYPKKPIIVEASANGTAAQKAAWLTKLGQAVNDIPSVYALLYHEGGPDLNASKAERQRWSLTSDSASLAVMRSIAINLHKKAVAHAAKPTSSLPKRIKS